MKSVKNNLNPSMNPVTTIIGLMFTMTGLILYILPSFYDLKTPFETYVLICIGVIGLGLILIPDDLKGALKSVVKRKAKTV